MLRDVFCLICCKSKSPVALNVFCFCRLSGISQHLFYCSSCRLAAGMTRRILVLFLLSRFGFILTHISYPDCPFSLRTLVYYFISSVNIELNSNCKILLFLFYEKNNKRSVYSSVTMYFDIQLFELHLIPPSPLSSLCMESLIFVLFSVP